MFKLSKFNFLSEHGPFVYQMKGNDECSNMQSDILSLHAPSTPGVGVRVRTCFFLKVFILHIKLIGMEHKASRKHIVCHNTPLVPRVGSKDQNIFPESTVSCCIYN